MKGSLFKKDLANLLLIVFTLIFVMSFCGDVAATARAKEERQMMSDSGYFLLDCMRKDFSKEEINAELSKHTWGVGLWVGEKIWCGLFRLQQKSYTVEMTAKICECRSWMLVSGIAALVSFFYAKKYGDESDIELKSQKTRPSDSRPIVLRSAEYEVALNGYGMIEVIVLLIVAAVGSIGFRHPGWWLLIAGVILGLLKLRRFFKSGGRFVRSPHERLRHRRGFRFPGFGRRRERPERTRPSGRGRYRYSWLRRNPKYSASNPLEWLIIWGAHFAHYKDY